MSAWSYARRLVLVTTTMAAAALISGCAAEYDHTDLNNVHAPPKPLDGRVNYARINVSVGAIVTARIVSYDDDHKELATDLRTKDTSVVEVTGVVREQGRVRGVSMGSGDPRNSGSRCQVACAQPSLGFRTRKLAEKRSPWLC